MIESKFQKKDYQNYSYYRTNLELIAQNQNLEQRCQILTEEYYKAQREIMQRDQKIKEQEDEILQMKTQLMNYEMKINQLTEDYSKAQLQLATDADSLDHKTLTIEVLEKQIYAINEALNNTQTSLESILSQKSKLITSKFKEFMDDDQVYKQITLPEYFTHSYNFNFEPFYDKIPQSMILDQADKINENKEPVTSNTLKMGSQDRLLTLDTSPDKKYITEETKGDEKDSSNDSSPNMESHMAGEGASLPKKSTFMGSFITNLDLQCAFANASNVMQISTLWLLMNLRLEFARAFGSALHSPFACE